MIAEFLIGIDYNSEFRGERMTCWNFCRLAAKEVFGLDYPAYPFGVERQEDREMLIDLFDRSSREQRWTPIKKGSEQAADILTTRIRGFPHCGLVVQPGWLLHCLKGRGSTYEQYNNGSWVGRNFYRFNSA